jgi:hypothetical protein
VTEDLAKELAERTNVTLERSGNKLIAKIDEPTLTTNQSVSVSLVAKVPNQTDLKLGTHNGVVVIANITGRVNAATHNGEVTTEKISGTTVIETHNGSVICKEISGDAQLKTHNGSIKASYSEAGPSVCDISIVAYNGSINFAAPADFSAQVDASTHNGAVNTDLAITVKGKVSKRKLTGTIGTGQGKLHLETRNGSIRIR